MLVADAVDRADEDSVGDGMCPLNGLPGVVLGCAELGLLAGVPADGRGVEERLCTAEGGDARRLREPLIPADERADGARAGGDRAEAKSPGVK